MGIIAIQDVSQPAWWLEATATELADPHETQKQVTPEEAMTLEDRWDREMDELLREGVLRYGAKWEEVSTHMKPHDCPKEEVEKRWVSISALLLEGSLFFRGFETLRRR